MPELLLDDVDRHALRRELGGVGVAQAVSVHMSMPARAASRGRSQRT